MTAAYSDMSLLGLSKMAQEITVSSAPSFGALVCVRLSPRQMVVDLGLDEDAVREATRLEVRTGSYLACIERDSIPITAEDRWDVAWVNFVRDRQSLNDTEHIVATIAPAPEMDGAIPTRTVPLFHRADCLYTEASKAMVRLVTQRFDLTKETRQDPSWIDGFAYLVPAQRVGQTEPLASVRQLLDESGVIAPEVLDDVLKLYVALVRERRLMSPPTTCPVQLGDSDGDSDGDRDDDSHGASDNDVDAVSALSGHNEDQDEDSENDSEDDEDDGDDETSHELGGKIKARHDMYPFDYDSDPFGLLGRVDSAVIPLVEVSLEVAEVFPATKQLPPPELFVDEFREVIGIIARGLLREYRRRQEGQT